MVYAIKERGGGAGGKSTCPLPLFEKIDLQRGERRTDTYPRSIGMSISHKTDADRNGPVCHKITGLEQLLDGRNDRPLSSTYCG